MQARRCMRTAPQERMCEGPPAANGEPFYRPYKQRKLTADAAHNLRAHLKELRAVAPKKRWDPFASSSALGPETPHGPSKVQHLHLIIPKLWPQTRHVNQHIPHQPDNQPCFSTQHTWASLPQRPPGSTHACLSQRSYLPPSSGSSAATITADKRPLNGMHAAAGSARRPAHAPISQAVLRHLQDTIKELRAADAHLLPKVAHRHTSPPQRGAAECSALEHPALACEPAPAAPSPSPSQLGFADHNEQNAPRRLGEGPEGSQHPAAGVYRSPPLTEPSPPKPRIKVWEYCPYSRHALSSPQSAGGAVLAKVAAPSSRQRKCKR